MAGEKKKKDITRGSIAVKFTVDSERTGLNEMPSITRLLNRKSMKNRGVTTPAPQGDPQAGPSGGVRTFLQRAIEDAKLLADERKNQEPVPVVPSIPVVNALPEAPSPPKPTPPPSQAKVSPPSSPPSSPPPPSAPKPAMSGPPKSLVPPPVPTGPAKAPALEAKTITLSVLPGQRTRGQSRPFPLFTWDLGLLGTSPDPMAQAASELIELGMTSALFLNRTEEPTPEMGASDEKSPASAPQFVAAAAYSAKEKAGLWAGLTWSPAAGSKLWLQLGTLACVELTPPDGMTVASSDRNIVRTAFGIESDEFLILARIGLPDDPRGILAIVSTQSLLDQVQARLILLTASIPKSKYIRTAA